jgi:alkylation response protein AidB-like acyl-CoA dehydrogenase
MDSADFFQDPPLLTNTFEADVALRELLERLVPAEAHAALAPQWRALGEQAAGPLMELARQAEAEPPRHVPYDAWGRRVDRIELSAAWTRLQEEAARWGLFAVPYEPGLGELARLHQGALLALYAPSSAIASCPLAMTDGAARTLLEHDPGLARGVVPRLTTRDPAALWTCGQWMTERAGGSDVGGTLTAARAAQDGTYRLYGSKWFTSAATSDAALTLARVEGAPAGGAGLTLFFLELRRADGSLNGLRVERLKDKLGTRALPTAELTLEGARAVPVGGLGHGVRKVASLLNTTRLHNAVNACGTMARLLQLLRDYARRRVVFGEPLSRKPLHRETLAGLQAEYEAALALTFECLRLLGRVESGAALPEESARLRLLTPVAKLATARQAVAAASEALEGFGGAGYVEDTGLPVWLRDAQVLPIWEGTTNVLSLDVLRAVAREHALAPWADDASARLQRLREGPLKETAAALSHHLGHVRSWYAATAERAPEALEPAARRFALAVAAVASGLGLCEQGAWALSRGRSERASLAARAWAAARLLPLPDPALAKRDADGRRVLGGLED